MLRMIRRFTDKIWREEKSHANIGRRIIHNQGTKGLAKKIQLGMINKEGFAKQWIRGKKKLKVVIIENGQGLVHNGSHQSGSLFKMKLSVSHVQHPIFNTVLRISANVLFLNHEWINWLHKFELSFHLQKRIWVIIQRKMCFNNLWKQTGLLGGWGVQGLAHARLSVLPQNYIPSPEQSTVNS